MTITRAQQTQLNNAYSAWISGPGRQAAEDAERALGDRPQRYETEGVRNGLAEEFIRAVQTDDRIGGRNNAALRQIIADGGEPAQTALKTHARSVSPGGGGVMGFITGMFGNMFSNGWGVGGTAVGGIGGFFLGNMIGGPIVGAIAAAIGALLGGNLGAGIGRGSDEEGQGAGNGHSNRPQRGPALAQTVHLQPLPPLPAGVSPPPTPAELEARRSQRMVVLLANGTQFTGSGNPPAGSTLVIGEMDGANFRIRQRHRYTNGNGGLSAPTVVTNSPLYAVSPTRAIQIPPADGLAMGLPQLYTAQASTTVGPQFGTLQASTDLTNPTHKQFTVLPDGRLHTGTGNPPVGSMIISGEVVGNEFRPSRRGTVGPGGATTWVNASGAPIPVTTTGTIQAFTLSTAQAQALGVGGSAQVQQPLGGNANVAIPIPVPNLTNTGPHMVTADGEQRHQHHIFLTADGHATTRNATGANKPASVVCGYWNAPPGPGRTAFVVTHAANVNATGQFVNGSGTVVDLPPLVSGDVNARTISATPQGGIQLYNGNTPNALVQGVFRRAGVNISAPSGGTTPTTTQPGQFPVTIGGQTYTCTNMNITHTSGNNYNCIATLTDSNGLPRRVLLECVKDGNNLNVMRIRNPNVTGASGLLVEGTGEGEGNPLAAFQVAGTSPNLTLAPGANTTELNAALRLLTPEQLPSVYQQGTVPLTSSIIPNPSNVDNPTTLYTFILRRNGSLCAADDASAREPGSVMCNCQVTGGGAPQIMSMRPYANGDFGPAQTLTTPITIAGENSMATGVISSTSLNALQTQRTRITGQPSLAPLGTVTPTQMTPVGVTLSVHQSTQTTSLHRDRNNHRRVPGTSQSNSSSVQRYTLMQTNDGRFFLHDEAGNQVTNPSYTQNSTSDRDGIDILAGHLWGNREVEVRHRTVSRTVMTMLLPNGTEVGTLDGGQLQFNPDGSIRITQDSNLPRLIQGARTMATP